MGTDTESLKDVFVMAAAMGCPVILCDQIRHDGSITHTLYPPDDRQPFVSTRLIECLIAANRGYGADVLMLGFDSKDQLRAAQYLHGDVTIDIPGEGVTHNAGHPPDGN